jgi:hypothetical protein
MDLQKEHGSSARLQLRYYYYTLTGLQAKLETESNTQYQASIQAEVSSALLGTNRRGRKSCRSWG